ncbi:MAG: TlpA family protein disulfide reductase [Spirochaetaceae bacterium]
MKHIILVLLIIILGSCAKADTLVDNNELYQQEAIRELETKLEAPLFSSKNLNGENKSLSDYKGKVLLLNFWASWCPPCISEMPSIEKLHQSVKDLDIEVISVNVGEKFDTVDSFMKEGNYNFEALLDENNIISNLYSIRNIPTTYIIDKDGFVVALKVGAHEWDSEGVIEILKSLAK